LAEPPTEEVSQGSPAQSQGTVYKVSDFISWQRIGSLELSQAFQRRPVWPTGAKPFLIDTIVRGIPIPIIFLRERSDPNSDGLEPKRQVVDGQQRLRTILGFVDSTLLNNFKDADSFTVQEEIKTGEFRSVIDMLWT
jgi:hypothetical protein